MSNTTKESTVSFLTTNELTKLLKKYKQNEDKALNFLIKVIENENVDIKVRVGCAKELIDKRIELSREINKDSFARLLAESRKHPDGVPKLKEVKEQMDDNSPVFVPDRVQRVSGAAYDELDEETDTYDLSNVGKM